MFFVKTTGNTKTKRLGSKGRNFYATAFQKIIDCISELSRIKDILWMAQLSALSYILLSTKREHSCFSVILGISELQWKMYEQGSVKYCHTCLLARLPISEEGKKAGRTPPCQSCS